MMTILPGKVRLGNMALDFMQTGQGAMLEAERGNASFRVESLTNLMDGGAEETARRRMVRDAIEGDAFMDSRGRIFQSREERYKAAMVRFRRAEQIVRGLGRSAESVREMMWVKDAPYLDDYPIALHFLMFMPNLKIMCTDQQAEYWLSLSKTFEIVGCYAQTELGHGSNVRGIETVATFLPETDEFEIHTPSLSALKWWPGSLGCTANTAIVFARLVIHGKDHGVHNFIVPIRSRSNHKLLPGVTAGDIGPKIGYNAMDNGWCRFDRVRIPRENMPMRFSSVSRDGKYEKRGHDKVGYVTMMELRALMIADCRGCLAKACTIAVRYSAVRRQGGGKLEMAGKPEMAVLDYPTQQSRLLPLVAACYAFHFTGKITLEATFSLRKDLGPLGSVHATLSGLKAVCTQIMADGIEECRKCCGGHGYLVSSGIPELLGFSLQYATAEGDSHVLAQQTSRYLLKALANAQGGDLSLLSGDCEYLKGIAGGEGGGLLQATCGAKGAAGTWQDPAMLQLAHRHRAAWLLVGLGSRYAALMGEGATPGSAWLEVQVEQYDAALAHAMAVLVANFASSIAPGGTPQPPAVLGRLLCLFALKSVLLHSGDLMASGFMPASELPHAQQAYRDLLRALRPDAVALVEAFDLSDLALSSAIGSRDGEAYQRLFASASSPSTGSGALHLRPKPEEVYSECIAPLSKL